MERGFFKQARPIWAEGLEQEKNVTLGLHTTFTGGGECHLKVATAGFYRVYVNGEFVHYGPARCAHGFFRVDEVPLALPDGQVHLAIEVVNYYINSFDYIKQPGFITAEVVMGDSVIVATGCEGISLYMLTHRVQKIQRYSYQRPFAEGYRLSPDYADWCMGKPAANAQSVETVPTEEKTYVPRRISLNAFPAVPFIRREAYGTLEGGHIPAEYKLDRSLLYIEDADRGNLGGYPMEELEWHLSEDVQEFANTAFVSDGTPYAGVTSLAQGEFEILALPGEKTGFIEANITCHVAGTLYFLMDETLRQTGDVDPNSMECCNVVRLDMQPGTYTFRTMAAYGFQYAKVVAFTGKCTLSGLCVRELICPEPVTRLYTGSDPALSAIYQAAIETFLQNSADLFMDCPTRERAGWLCDSFFTARAEKVLTGKNVIEKNYLENYLLPASFRDVPEGMVPMCYPADHNQKEGNYIPNWAMWLVLELEDRMVREGDREFILAFRDRVYGLLRWFAQYENADGLLEKLPGWVFLEWSRANDLTQDINFPSNMLYARMLEAAAGLFDDAALTKKAAALKTVIRERSFDGEFFVDNEVYRDGVPVSSGERTETCQYYAFFSGVATPESYPDLWRVLTTDFGPQRTEQGLYPEIHPSNAFIGNYLRLSLLEQYGLYEQLLTEVKGYFLYMAQRTGTLWENISDYASCNHGFASCAARFIQTAEKP